MDNATMKPFQAMQAAIDAMETLLMLDATHSVSMSEEGRAKTKAALVTIKRLRAPVMTTETAQQVCNDCGGAFPPSQRDNPTNPLCGACTLEIKQELGARRFAISTALEDRERGFGLMARMSDERFARYVARQVELFNEARSKLG